MRCLRPYRTWVALAPVAMAVETSMDLAQPALMRRIVDDGVAAGSAATIRETGLRMLCCALVGALGGVACTYVSARAATGVARDLRKALFAKILSLDRASVSRFGAGSLSTRLTSDVATLQSAVSAATRGFLRAPMLLAGSIGLVLAADLRLALPLLAMAPVLAWIVARFAVRATALFRERQIRTDDLASRLRESVEGIRVVKSFAREDRVAAAFRSADRALARTGLRLGFAEASLGPSLQAVQQGTLVAIVFLAAAGAGSGMLEAGRLFAVVNWSSQVMGSLVMMSFHVMHFSGAVVAARRVSEVLDGPCAAPDGPVRDEAPRDGSVELRGVSFGYGGGAVPVLKDVSLRIASGERVAVVGATGSGKSTLLALLSGFRRPAAGSVLVGGVDAARADPAALRSAIGLVPQTPRLFSGSVAWNLRWGDPEAPDGTVRSAARAACADGFVSALPDGFDSRVSRGGANFSGGQRQRLSVARALVRRPKLLLLDDATSALDPATEALVVSGLRRECPDATVVCVSHRPGTIRAADRILVLDGGRLVGDGTHEALLRDCREYREIAGA